MICRVLLRADFNFSLVSRASSGVARKALKLRYASILKVENLKKLKKVNLKLNIQSDNSRKVEKRVRESCYSAVYVMCRTIGTKIYNNFARIYQLKLVVSTLLFCARSLSLSVRQFAKKKSTISNHPSRCVELQPERTMQACELVNIKSWHGLTSLPM